MKEPRPDQAPQGILVDRTPHPCPYLDDRTAVLPLRWYRERIQPEHFDTLLAQADRRVGRTLYHPACPACDECKGIRLQVDDVVPSRSQKRTLKRNEDVRVVAGTPIIDRAHIDLFNKHKIQRGLDTKPISPSHYRNWLSVTCTNTIETRYFVGDKLVAVGILDMGKRDASSVYFYFDPDESKRSLGVFSVLAECRWLRRSGYRYYYLGLYVAGCKQLSYKDRFLPHERLEAGAWRRYEAP